MRRSEGCDCHHAPCDHDRKESADVARVLSTVADAVAEGVRLGIPIDALLLAAGQRDYPLDSLCPACGPSVPVDEDGCCIHCGGDAVGDGADLAIAALRTVERVGRERDQLLSLAKSLALVTEWTCEGQVGRVWVVDAEDDGEMERRLTAAIGSPVELEDIDEAVGETGRWLAGEAAATPIPPNPKDPS